MLLYQQKATSTVNVQEKVNAIPIFDTSTAMGDNPSLHMLH